jgi:hypothetical protein
VPAPAPGPWTIEGRLGAYLTSVVATRTEDTRDTAIAETNDVLSVLLKGTLRAVWERDPHRIEQTLEAKYGRQRDAVGDWEETTDLIEYRGVEQRSIAKPHYAYLSWGADSQFTGREDRFADPTTARTATGYGQRRELQPEKDRVLDARAGVRAQTVFGSGLDPAARQVEVGPEALARYEAKPVPGTAWFAQAEAFSEFDDLAHVQLLFTAGLTADLGRGLTVDASLRVAHETRPREDEIPGVDYHAWALRQETLVGLTWSF